MTSAVPIADVDEQTREELRPPCEVVDNGAPCEKQADWILRWSCSCIDLACDEHTRRVLKVQAIDPIFCDEAHDCLTRIVSTERI